ncbi:MAG: helix-turn-helix transcriptional regulator [Gemmatirosa sp.]|nr:helix-turn-helix transcriptional regulator [Gemmatirosa sp.]
MAPSTSGADAKAAALVTLILLPPPADLAALVEYVWQLVLPPNAPPGALWRVVPDGYVDVATRLALTPEVVRAAATPESRRERRAVMEALAASPTVVCGAAATARTLPMTEPLLVTGARFRLGAAAGVLRRAPADLVDGSRPLREVIDARAAGCVRSALAVGAARHADAQSQAQEPVDAGRAIRALARAGTLAVVRRLAARADAGGRGVVAPDPRVLGALHLLERNIGVPTPDGGAESAPVATVGRALGVSLRTLDRLFAEQVGFSPRTYQRLRRVGAVAESLERAGATPAAPAPGRGAPRPATLSDLAHRLGYTDHAHMTREFTRVMGVGPAAYRREAAAAPVERRMGAVAFERSVPFGTVGTRDP